MKRTYVLLLALIIVIGATALTADVKAENKATVFVKACGSSWPSEPYTAVTQGGSVTNINYTSNGTFVTISRECVVCAETCFPSVETHVYAYYD